MDIDRDDKRPNWTDESLPFVVRRKLLADELRRLGTRRAEAAKAADRPEGRATPGTRNGAQMNVNAGQLLANGMGFVKPASCPPPADATRFPVGQGTRRQYHAPMKSADWALLKTASAPRRTQ